MKRILRVGVLLAWSWFLIGLSVSAEAGKGEIYMPSLWPNMMVSDNHHLVLDDGSTWRFQPTTQGGPGGFDFRYGGEGTNCPSDDQFYHGQNQVLFRYRFRYCDGTQLWYVWPMAMAPLVWDGGEPWVYEGRTTAILIQDGRIIAGPIEAMYRTTIHGWEQLNGQLVLHWSQEWLGPQSLSEWRREDLYFAELPVVGDGTNSTAWGPKLLRVVDRNGFTHTAVIDHWQRR